MKDCKHESFDAAVNVMKGRDLLAMIEIRCKDCNALFRLAGAEWTAGMSLLKLSEVEE